MVDFGKEFKEVLDEVTSYDPEGDRSKPLRYKRVLKMFPYFEIGANSDLPALKTSLFSEFAYCPYTTYHHAIGTRPKRIRRAQEALDRGTRVHTGKELEETKKAREVPAATIKQLQDPDINIIGLPEFPTHIKYGNAIFKSKIDRVRRISGFLVITEIKSGGYYWMPDQLLQTWTYSISAPSGLQRMTSGNFNAREITWALEYTAADKSMGPFFLTENILGILKRAMSMYISLYDNSIKSLLPSNIYYPYYSKCSPCQFSYECPWSAAVKYTGLK